MKILLVINGLEYGGSESALADLARELAARGHAVHVLSLKRLGRLGRTLAVQGLAVGALDMAEAVGVRQTAGAVARLARRLARERYDVVHSFLPRANVLSRLANRLCGHRAVHLSSEHSPDAHRARAVSALNRLTAAWTDLVLAVSPRVRDVLVSREGIPEDRVRVLANPVDLAAVDATAPAALRRALGLGDGAVLACSVGRLVRDKGHVYLVRALAATKPGRPPLHLALVGDGPEEDAIRRQVARSGLAGRVHLLGFRADVAAVLKACDLFVLPSLEEGLPVTLLEAMACRCPVIATDVGDVATLVEDGETGLLVPPPERWAPAAAPPGGGRGTDERSGVAALAAALDRLAADAAARAKLAAAARRRIEERYALGPIVTSVEALYRALAAGRR